ncbi:MAG: Metal dependent phosphohydrolase [Thermoanaerobacterales bacterium 50_218]|nr:MAG: Metal dependent phosphohydrolase [Thermoanaerobacterales bacterium 50_218]HAA88981.1 hypothetical protein [Peptococcaceae bacterium]
MGQLSVTRQLAFFLLLVIVVMVAGGVFIILGVRSFGEDSNSMIEERTTKIILAQDVARCIQDFLLTWQDYQLTGDSYEWERLQELAKRIDRELKEIRPLLHTPTGKEKLERLEEVWNSCREQVIFGEEMSAEEAGAILFAYAREANKAADDFLAWQQRQFRSESESLVERVGGVVEWITLVVLSGVASVLLMGTVASRAITAHALVAEMVLSTTRNAVVTVDRRGRITAVNQVFEELFGTPAKSLVNRLYETVCRELYPLVEVMREGKVRQGEEVRFRDAQGGEKYLLADAVPWRDQRQRIIGGMLVLRDITGRKLLEAKIREEADYFSVLSRTTASILEIPLSRADYASSVARVLLEGVCAFTGVEKACFFSCEEVPEKIRLETAIGLECIDDLEKALSTGEQSPIRAVCSTLKPLYLPKTEASGLRIPSISSAYFVPVQYISRLYGVVGIFAAEKDAFPEGKRKLLDTFVAYAGAALENARLYQELKKDVSFGVITALCNAIDAKDSFTGGHGQRLVEMALALARELGCSEQECEDIRWAAVLHDVGKIGVPDGILSKPGSLTDEEWQLMRKHPVLGYQILSPISALKNAARYVRHHHERFDGRGYSDGLKGEEIPLGARIIAVADTYVAMTEDRIYRKGCSHQEALAELQRCSGTQFDPKVVEAFVRLFSDQTKAFA